MIPQGEALARPVLAMDDEDLGDDYSWLLTDGSTFNGGGGNDCVVFIAEGTALAPTTFAGGGGRAWYQGGKDFLETIDVWSAEKDAAKDRPRT